MLDKFIEIMENEVAHLLREELSKEQLILAREAILNVEKNGGRVHVMGIGKPSYVAGYIASLLSSTGTPAYLLDGTEAVHGSSGQVKEEDVVIAISNSGETAELLASVHTLLNNGVTIIGVSSNEQSTLNRLAHYSLIAKVEHEGDDLGKPPRTSVINQIILLQCLSILLQEAKQMDMETYVKWHPAGSIGKSIDKGK